MAVVIPSAEQVGALYTVPRSDWVAINNRVAIVIEVQGIANQISRYIPNYNSLLAACQQWKSTTLPTLIAQAVQASLFATRASSTLTTLSGELAPLEPSDPLPDTVRFIFRVQFEALQQDAGKLSQAAGQTTPQITNFVAQNRAADVSLEKVLHELGPAWEQIGGPITTLEGAMSDVQGGWSAVQTAFGDAAANQATLTTAELLSADVQAAITSWNAVAQDATAFDSQVSSQTSTV